MIYKQLCEYFDKIFSKYLCGFRKGYNSQHCLLIMLERLKQALDKGLCTGLLLTDLSKAFDCLSHDLLIAKLNAYGVSYKSLKFIENYLSDRKQRTKVNGAHSTWRNILHGVPQGSILGPLLFNIYINDIFLFSEEFDIVNYADDCTPYECGISTESVIESLERDTITLFEWYENNYLRANPEKCHLLLSNSDTNSSIVVSNKIISNSKNERLLGVIFDNTLSFETHITKLCKTASQKIHALARVSNFMSLTQRKLIMNAFISAQFGYCPLIWMLHSRKLNNRINRIQERALRIVYRDSSMSFEELLIRSGTVKIHHKNLQVLVTEIFKVLNNLSPSLMREPFELKVMKYKLRNNSALVTRNIISEKYGTETLSFLGSKLWLQVPKDIKLSTSLTIFKNKIKSWKPKKCPCKLCKIYVPKFGYL